MDEIKRVVHYIRSCRDANIDVIVTIDKNKSHQILNALEKQIAATPKGIKNIDFQGSIRRSFKNGSCPCCNNYIDTDDDLKFCTECGQKLDWDN